jgi:ketosteroid isomerase-like protein
VIPAHPRQELAGRLLSVVSLAWLGPTLLLLMATGCATTHDSGDPRSALESASRAYAAAWMTNDADAVLETLTEDAVIVPSGMAPVEGRAAIRAFWFPEGGPPTTVESFEVEIHETTWEGSLGVVRGAFTLAFDYDGVFYERGGTYVDLLRPLPDGSWRISRRMWSDVPL